MGGEKSSPLYRVAFCIKSPNGEISFSSFFFFLDELHVFKWKREELCIGWGGGVPRNGGRLCSFLVFFFLCLSQRRKK